MAERPNERTAKVKPEESESRRGCRASAATTARANPLNSIVQRTLAQTRGLYRSLILAGPGEYAMMIKPGEEIHFGAGQRFRVVDLVSFEEEDESPFVGLLKVEAA
jgi:hypothetical protein